MTLLYTSSTKLFSFLLSSSSSNKSKSSSCPISSDKTTVHISIIPHKDGSRATTKCLNPTEPALIKKPKLGSFLKFSGSPKRHRPTLSPADGPLERLPPELVQQLFGHLDAASIGRLAQTCRRLHMICSDDHGVWRTLFIKHFFPHPSNGITWNELYRNHYLLERRWRSGQAHVRYLTGHTDSVYCIIRYKRQFIISGSRDHSVKLWDLDNHTCVASQTHHEGSVLCLKISSDNEWMVSGSSDGTCVIWQLDELRPIGRLRGHTSGVLDVCIVENKYIVTASRDATVRVWDRESGKELRRLEGHSGPVNALQAHGCHVVSASGDSKLKLWNAETGECVRTFDGHARGLACARYDGKRIYSGGQDAALRVWDAETGECTGTLEGHEQLVRTVDCCGDRAVTGSYDRTIKLWDVLTGQCLLSFQGGHESWVFNVLLNRTQIISAGQDKRIMILDFGNNLSLAD
ncbi:WD40-repeat-containing domain protein [Fennellomyces sp. T-0311]|nr:WD40-repeat-containing domain protein [Fennellomyces sp. T-0311]